jgi:hypothetical protein
MAAFDDLFKNNVATGLIVGIGVAVLSPVIIPIVASVVRPMAKSAIKAGLLLYERGLETGSEMAEGLEDLIAEAKAELETTTHPASGATPATETTPDTPK